MINESVEKVSEGTELVDKSGESLAEIVESVKKVSTIVGDISEASEEQARGLDQVNKAVMKMDSITQQNGALVEQTAAASEARPG